MLLCPFPGEAENGRIAAAEAGNDETAAEEGKFAVSGTVRDSTDSNPVAGAQRKHQQRRQPRAHSRQ